MHSTMTSFSNAKKISTIFHKKFFEKFLKILALKNVGKSENFCFLLQKLPIFGWSKKLSGSLWGENLLVLVH